MSFEVYYNLRWILTYVQIHCTDVGNVRWNPMYMHCSPRVFTMVDY